ncbi:uncharacterized protein LOC143067450 isoform X1 [Mytilus galloprovincialis]|uniref:uncharacterized protein LOC143067450 isoform X1 n=1 Tax=Mytilus galloprovincialis TaxID=29158 RepID=UPI003F7C7092
MTGGFWFSLIGSIMLCLQIEVNGNDLDTLGKDFKIQFYDADGNYTDTGFVGYSDNSSQKNRRASLRPGKATSTDSCDHVRGVPTELRSSSVMKPHGLATFYQKYTEAYGIPILSSWNVNDDALKRACYITRFLFADNYAVRNSFYQRSGRSAVIGVHEGTTSIPEHSHMDPSFWDNRARGLGATDSAPVSTGGEENLLCLQNDRYHSEDIYLHEFAHGVANLGARYGISGWFQRLENQYKTAKQQGLWAHTYSMSSSAEYFAEGVQSFFNVNDYSATPNGIHGPISTRDKLRTYDPALYQLIEEVWPCHNTYLKRCVTSRAQEQQQNIRTNCDGSTSGGGGGASCKDGHLNCHSWATNGECSRNPGYMLVNCKHSCNTCNGQGSTSCTDHHQFCHDWAGSGECSRNPAYMNENCKKSCNRC